MITLLNSLENLFIVSKVFPQDARSIDSFFLREEEKSIERPTKELPSDLTCIILVHQQLKIFTRTTEKEEHVTLIIAQFHFS